MNKSIVGDEMYKWASDLFPIFRSITGPGVRTTLNYLKNIVDKLEIKSIASGTEVFDWVVPQEWQITEAYIEDEEGNKIIDFKKNNLHVVGYSCAVDQWLSLEELNKNLHSLPNQPTAVPYITSYYINNWGFCLSHDQRLSLKDIRYHVVINSEFSNGVLNYGEIYLPGESKEEVLLSTYICHPSMANNELSGPVVTVALAREIEKIENRRYSYRFIFIPETIGAIAYLSIGQNYKLLKQNVIAGFQITCVGDDRCYSFIPSRKGNTLADSIAEYVLQNYIGEYLSYSFLERGSDERQWCSPGIDLPIVSIMRSKYGEYPEYHTSLDNLDLITAEGLVGAYNSIRLCLDIIEHNFIPITTVLCEPQLGKRGLYPNVSTKDTKKVVKAMMNLISYSDGDLSLLEISKKIGEDFFECLKIANSLIEVGLMRDFSSE